MRLSLLNENAIDEIIFMENEPDTSEFIIPYSEEKHRQEITNPNIKYLGIYEKGELCGFIMLCVEKKGKRIELRRIVIRQKGLGLGQKAIKKLEQYCKDFWNTEKIWLDVFEHNERGIHIYQKFGFKKEKITKYKSKNLWIMKKSLIR